MDSSNENRPLKRLRFGILLLLLGASLRADGAVLKLADTPLSQVLELYSTETGRSIFVDEGVQQQRRVTAYLQGIPIEEAFGVIQKTLGLESYLIGTGTLILFPSDRVQRYRPAMKSLVLRLPGGLDPKWVTGLLNTFLPAVKVAVSPLDPRSLVILCSETQVPETRALVERLPEVRSVRGFAVMPEKEARLAAQEVRNDGLETEITPAGLSWRGAPQAVATFERELGKWRRESAWDTEVFTLANLDSQKALKAAEAARGSASVSDLGGTGSLLIEGPAIGRRRLIKILSQLDGQARFSRCKLTLAEIKPDAAVAALRTTGLSVEPAGDRNVVVSGKPADVEDALGFLGILDKKRRQVLIRFRLAEVSRDKMKTLGIDLEKSSFGYAEIKDYHPKDVLPLILRVLNEGKDARILAEPNLRVLEGEEAKVVIGDRIPLEIAATAQTDSGSTLKLQAQLSWVDVGITMKVKDVLVGSDGSIRMGLRNEVSSVVSTTKQGYPQIRTREAESRLRLKDGGSVIMGGLLSQEERENRSRIPLISQLPLVGGFARSRDRNTGATEIVMIVTAKLVED